MANAPDVVLVNERLALPSSVDRAAPFRAGCARALKGCLGRIWFILPRFGALARDGPVRVLIPPSPGTFGYATLFTPAPQVLRNSRQALVSCREAYRDDPDFQAYPWRMVAARHTGLPASLRGFLNRENPLDNDDEIVDVASRWLFQNPRAQALTGIEDPSHSKRLFSFFEIGQSQVVGGKGHANGRALVHVRYRQWHQDQWPVFGGQLVAHLASNDRRTAVTSSFFPLDHQSSFSPRIDRVTAIATAEQALAAYLDGFPAVGLYWFLLRNLVRPREMGTTSAEAWQGFHSHLADRMVRTLTASPEGRDILPEGRDIAPGDLPKTRNRLIQLLREIGERLVPSGLANWHVDVPFYAGSELFILPFAGAYHLAYQIVLSSYVFNQCWRVFVDAETGDVLGRPEDLALHAKYFATAASALAGGPLHTKPLTQNPSQHFMYVGIYNDPDQPKNDTEPDWQGNATSGPHFEAASVAVHADEVFDYFVDKCGADATKLESEDPRLRARVAMQCTSLLPVFISDPEPDRRLLVFPTDEHGGLSINGKKVHHPTYDPEFTYHEVTHGLMWLLNRQPFDDLVSSVPFGRALVEGYANYMGRSIAETSDSTKGEEWARAAYRAGKQSMEWDDTWALSREKLESGADKLPAPNLYPHRKTSGLAVYEVGMVWARALWDLRESAELSLEPHQVDSFALDAHNYLHGWVASFEMAAEGVIDAGTKAGIAQMDVVGRKLFYERCILACQSIQALARQGNVLLAGADAGLMRSNDNGNDNTWQDWDDLDHGNKLTDVVALAADGADFYAAVETVVGTANETITQMGIYKRASNGPRWSPVGQWPEDQTPYTLMVADHQLYVGTGHGVWHYDENSGWPEGPIGDFLGVAFDLAYASLPALNNTRVLYAAGFDAVYFSQFGSSHWIPVGINQEAAVVAVAARGNDAYLGTLAHGIWRMSNLVDLERIDLQESGNDSQLESVAVLTLVVRDDGSVLAGTTKGLYVGTRGANDAWTWVRLGSLDDATITVVLPIDNDVLASTATRGLWRWKDANQQWQQVQGVGSLTAGN